MSRALLTALATVALLTACAADTAPTGPPLATESANAAAFGEVDPSRARDLPPSDGPLPADATGSGGWLPTSEPIEEGVVYRFTLGHCGLQSPVDVDGSFWDPVDGVTASGAPLDFERDGEMINATPGLIVVIGDEARYRTETGTVVRFERHDGEKSFPPCM